MPYVYSTASADTCYTGFVKVTKDLNQPTKRVLIKGGSNVMDKKRTFTPLGVATNVTEEELDWLLKHPLFKKHMDRGFIRITKNKQEPESVVGDMTTRDKSAQLAPGDYSEDKAPKTGSVAA